MLMLNQVSSHFNRFEEKHSQIETHLMLFSPWCYGHYPSYLRHLIYYWCQWQLPGKLSIVVSLEFLREHADVVALANQGDRHIKFVTMTEQEQKELEATTSGWSRAFRQHQLVVKYASQLKVTRVLYMYFDSCLLPLIMGFRLPCAFSGIYFRPTFYYSLWLKKYLPTWKERLQQWRERIFLSRLLKHPQLETLFCLDPIAVEYINRLGRAKAVWLADPIEVEEFSNEQVVFKKHLDIEPARRVLLSFGRLSEPRKGIIQLIKAVSLLSPELCKKICLLFAGEPNGLGEQTLESWLAPIRQQLPIQIITRYGYVPESDVRLYFQVADLILAPYQRHVGMSGILLQAAAAEKPVLSSDYGLMGEIVRRYSLGLAVDSTSPDEIAQALTRFLSESVEKFGDREQMKCFAAQNSAEQFVNTIFKHTLYIDLGEHKPENENFKPYPN